MIAVNEKILVRVDMQQKNYRQMGDVTIKSATEYDTNYRERSPVLAEAMETNGSIMRGETLICHHNMFYGNSAYWLKDDLFSIPCKNTTIFAKVNSKGEAKPILGNVIAERVEIPSEIELPPEDRKYYLDRVTVLQNAFGYKKGELIFVKPYSPYEIVYVFKNIERRVVKVNIEMIVGRAKK